MVRIMIGMLQAFQLGEVLGVSCFGGGLLRKEMHVLEPRNPAFNADLFSEGTNAGRLIERSDGKFKIIVTVFVHVEGGSAFGAKAPRHNDR